MRRREGRVGAWVGWVVAAAIGFAAGRWYPGGSAPSAGKRSARSEGTAAGAAGSHSAAGAAGSHSARSDAAAGSLHGAAGSHSAHGDAATQSNPDAAGSHSAHGAARGQPGPGAPGDGAGVSTWTCSMHPQIRLPKPGTCPLCGMDLIPLVEEHDGGEVADPRRLRMSAAARALARIETAPVVRRNVVRSVAMVGNVAFDETRVETISARFPGRLDRLFVDYAGVPVKTDDHLASIYSPELRTAQQELLQALRAGKEVSGNLPLLRAANKATIEAAREKLRLWGLSAWQVKQIERSGKVSDRLTLYARQAGVVVEKHAREGAYVQEGSPIYTVADLRHLWVHLDAYETDLVWLRYGQEVRFETEAYPGEVFSGKLAFIQPVLDERTRTVKVRVNIENPRGRLKPGMFLRARVLSEIGRGGVVTGGVAAGRWVCPMHPEVVAARAAKCRVCGMPLVTTEALGLAAPVPSGEPPLVVPATAPLLTGKRALVYVEVPEAESPTYEARVVVLGPRAGDVYVVDDGLREGERVVVEGAFRIDSAVQLRAGPGMMSLPSEPARVRDGGGGRGPEAPVSGAPARGALAPLAAALRDLAPAVAAVGAAVDAGDSDAASEGFERLAAPVSALAGPGMTGASGSRARDLVAGLREAVALGSEAWELPEQRRALATIRRLVGELRSAAGDPGPGASPAGGR